MLTRRELLAAGAAAQARPAPPAARPNIVLILADDLGWSDVSCQGGPIATPNIDRVAREGVRFEQFYAAPLCTPSRAALMTGRSPMHYGLAYSVVRPWSAYGLPPDEHVMAETFRAAGYQTAITGKWHLGHAHRRLLPNARGFDHFYGHVNAEIDYFKHTHVFTGGLDWQRNGVGVREEGYSTDLIGREAARVIRERDPRRPLFLYTAFNAPHTPLQAPAELIEKYRHIPNERRRVYYAMVDALDRAVGGILDAIEQQKMARDTIVMFLSDNGSAGNNNAPLRAGKMSAFEGGVRVPALLRWPGRIKAGAASRLVASILDVFPTLAAAVGLAPGASKPLDGVNLWPQITSGSTTERGSLFFASKQNEALNYNYGVRKGDWKLVIAPGAEPALFNLAEDPGEKKDLAAQKPDFARALLKELEEWKALHPRCDIDSSIHPHPGWIPPEDYAAAVL